MRPVHPPQAGSWLFTILLFLACGVLLISYRYSEKKLAIWRFTLDHQKIDEVGRQDSGIDDYKTLWKVANDLKNNWLYFRSIAHQSSSDQISNIDDAYVVNNARLSDLMEKSAEERKRKLDVLASSIRKRIKKVQNPPDCGDALKGLIDIKNSPCGFGCTTHSVVGGFMKAFLTNRTFILHSEGWKYAEEGWEYALFPVSSCKAPSSWKNDRRILQYEYKIPWWITWHIPWEIEPLLKKLHGDPYSWWVAQFTNYIFQLQPLMERDLENLGQEIGFTESAVGVQVRWGDKVDDSVAAKHEVEEYMTFVETWFRQLEQRGQSVTRTVYLSTDEIEVWNQMREKYHQYKFIGNLRSTETKEETFKYTHTGLENVITDIHFLSRCSYVVCTLSSSVCRTAYELMMNKHADASVRFQSIDTVYRLKVGRKPIWGATMDHNPANVDEMTFKKGDELKINPDPNLPFNDGFLRGTNLRTSEKGKIPIFKVSQMVLPYNETEKQAWLLEKLQKKQSDLSDV